jgi:putative Mn2+ efflux pump MntP
MEPEKKRRVILEVVPGAVISLFPSYFLAQGNNFVQAFVIFYIGIWFLIFAFTYETLFFKRKYEKLKRKNESQQR